MNRRISDVVLGIYRAAEDPRNWGTCLQDVQAIVRGCAASLLYLDPFRPGPAVHSVNGFSNEALDVYGRYYGRLDPWGLGLTPADFVPGRVIDGREVASEHDVRRSEYYHDFGRKFGSVHAIFAILEPGERIGLVSLNRNDRQAAFDHRELQILRLLAPHFRQALRLYRRLSAAESFGALTCEALSKLQRGVVLLTRGGRVCFMNAAASRIVALQDGLYADAAGVRGAFSTDTDKLAQAILAAAALGTSTAIDNPPVPLSLSRPSGRRPLQAIVVPANQPGLTLGYDTIAVAALFVDDPASEPIGTRETLTRLFNLTPVEAQVAVDLLAGNSTADIAGRLSLSRPAVRWHLKRIFQKVGVSSQARLVSALLRALPTDTSQMVLDDAVLRR